MFKNYVNSLLSPGLNRLGMRKNTPKTSIAIKGEHAIYKVDISFVPEYDTLHLVSKINIKFAKKDISRLKDAILLINSRLVIGRFDLTLDKEKNIELTYQISQPFFKESNADISAVSKYLDIIISTLNNCYPCFVSLKRGEIKDLGDIDLFLCDPVYTV